VRAVLVAASGIGFAELDTYALVALDAQIAGSGAGSKVMPGSFCAQAGWLPRLVMRS
jgi:hypothetical protein